MSGLELGKCIREKDPHANLVFVTTHEEMVFLALQMSFGVCNYLLKDDANWQTQLQQTLKNIEYFHSAWSSASGPTITLHQGGFYEIIRKEDIYYIRSVKNQHRIKLSLKNGERTLPESLSRFAGQLGNSFAFCRRDCLVNLAHVRNLDARKRLIELDNGESLSCSARMINDIRKRG